MKMPNGYGSVVKLAGKRRKPYGVRVSYVEKGEDGIPQRKRKWVGYFETREAALRFQASLSPDIHLSDLKAYQEAPTFAELYDEWISSKKKSVKGLTKAYIKNLSIAYGMLSPVQDRRITSIRASELQDIISSHSSKSKSTLGNMRTVIKGVYEYAVMNGYVTEDRNPAKYLHFDSAYKSVSIHRRFTDQEVETLWENLYVVNNVDCVLLMIYTGMRPSEMLEILTENVHLDKRYMVGGLKTDNGYDRLIPLCDKILPVVRRRYNPESIPRNPWSSCLPKSTFCENLLGDLRVLFFLCMLYTSSKKHCRKSCL